MEGEVNPKDAFQMDKNKETFTKGRETDSASEIHLYKYIYVFFYTLPIEKTANDVPFLVIFRKCPHFVGSNLHEKCLFVKMHF
jgi:hypothetical protein